MNKFILLFSILVILATFTIKVSILSSLKIEYILFSLRKVNVDVISCLAVSQATALPGRTLSVVQPAVPKVHAVVTARSLEASVGVNLIDLLLSSSARIESLISLNKPDLRSPFIVECICSSLSLCCVASTSRSLLLTTCAVG